MGKKGKSSATRTPGPTPPRLTPAQAARLTQAIAAHQAGDIDGASAVYRALLAQVPRCFDALNLLGAAAIQKGELAAGRDLIRQALAVDPTQAHAHSNLSRALLELGDAPGAVAACDRAVALKPQASDAWYNRGNALLALNRLDEARESYQRALALRPAYPDALNNLATTLRLLRQSADALAALDACLRLAPGMVNALNNRGLAYLDLGRSAEALASFDQALALQPALPEALNNRGNTLMGLRRYDEAAATFERLAEIAPDYMYVQGNLLHARMQCCDWRDHAALVADVLGRVRAGGRADFPFSFLCVSDSAAAQLACARTYTNDQYPEISLAPATRRGAHPRIRVAYVSGDFGEHPVSYLLAGVLQRHDQRAFETVAVSWGRQGEGALRERIERSCSRFIDVSGLGDDEIARMMRTLEIDIAVDLTGHTRGNRTGIFARRAAPVQVNYLGLPATMGAAYMDYLIADRVLIPPPRQDDYAEKPVWMPECFQPSAEHPVTVASSRAALGLPASGSVLCCFNNPAKLNPALFDIWMRLLTATPGAVLWLLAPLPAVAANLRVQAAARGVDPMRLVFAPRASYAEYLGRYAHADLFLDSLPFNAGATASDALGQGVPLLTCAGDSFAARMATSLLTTLGLPELACTTLADYEVTARALLSRPDELVALRARLTALRAAHAYHDTDRYRRHLESAWRTMHARHLQGLPPQSFAVEPIG